MKQDQARQAKEQQILRQQQEEQSKQLKGRILLMLTKLEKDETPKEFSASGIDLGPARTRILAGQVAYNNTLSNLHLSRAGIKDDSGADVARILYNNTTLRKLELEGNNLGPRSAKEFAKALRVNKTLQFLDLESNQLVGDGEDTPGILDLISALEENDTLISLNIGNNKLEASIGHAIRTMLQKNTTLIDLEIAFNNFTLEDVR